jgi:hypothetical protein
MKESRTKRTLGRVKIPIIRYILLSVINEARENTQDSQAQCFNCNGFIILDRILGGGGVPGIGPTAHAWFTHLVWFDCTLFSGSWFVFLDD